MPCLRWFQRFALKPFMFCVRNTRTAISSRRPKNQDRGARVDGGGRRRKERLCGRKHGERSGLAGWSDEDTEDESEAPVEPEPPVERDSAFAQAEASEPTVVSTGETASWAALDEMSESLAEPVVPRMNRLLALRIIYG